MAKKKKQQPNRSHVENVLSQVSPITPSEGRKRGLKSGESADQEYIQRLADVDCADGMERP